MIPQMVGMFQKEVAERVASAPGSKVYGILSVLLQAYYDIDYLFTVHEHVFDPPPKVKSGVIRLVRNNVEHLSEASRAMRTSVFVKNGSTLYAAGIRGSAAVSFTIANVTGEGPVVPAHLVKRRKCMLLNAFAGRK